MKKIIRKFFLWLFKDEINKVESLLYQCEQERNRLQYQAGRVENLLSNLDISVDLHHYAPSWAVISLQGKSTDYIKFIEMNDRNIQDISSFLRQFERSKIDCSPMERGFFRRDSKLYKI